MIRPPRELAAVGAPLALFLILWIGKDLPAASESALIPREDNHRDSAIRRAVDLIRRGDHSRGIQILQEIVEDPAACRVLRGVPADFGPGKLLPASREGDPLGDDAAGEAAGNEPPAQAAAPSPASPRGEIRIAEPPERASQLYLPVDEVARQLLAGLSPEGVAVYRKIYDPLAQRRIEQALAVRSPALLQRAAEDFAPSTLGMIARQRLAESQFEAGRFWSALAGWRSILAERAGPEVVAGEVELQCLAALRLLGEEAEYREARKAFLSHLRAQSGSDGLAGAFESLLAWITQFEADHPPPASPGVSASPGTDGAPLPKLPGTRLELEWVSNFWSDRSGSSSQIGRGLPMERSFPFFPRVAADGPEDAVYLNGIFRLQKLSALSGRVARIYTKPLPSRDLLHFEERSDSPAYCVSLGGLTEDDGARGGPGTVILASFLSDRVKSQSFRGYEIYSEIPTRSLCAIDAADGRIRWQTGELTIGQASKVVSFTTPALVVGRRVIACGWQQVGYTNSILAAFDLATGQLLWHQLLAASQLELTMFGEMGREPFASVLAEREGVVYCVTNLGAVAAVEADTGNIRWLTTYPVMEVEPGEGQRSPIREIGWGVNPPLFMGENLIVTPRDSEYLLAIDIGPAAGPPRARRQPGRIRFSYSNSDRELRDLLGQSEGILYFTGPGGVQALDVRDIASGGAPRRVPSTLGWTEKGVEGRGALTDSGVVVAAETPGWTQGIEGVEGAARRESRLCLVDRLLKARVFLTGALPKMGLSRGAGPVKPGLDAGNVLVANGRVLLTSRESIACFTYREPAAADDAGPGQARGTAVPAAPGGKGAAPGVPPAGKVSGTKREEL